MLPRSTTIRTRFIDARGNVICTRDLPAVPREDERVNYDDEVLFPARWGGSEFLRFQGQVVEVIWEVGISYEHSKSEYAIANVYLDTAPEQVVRLPDREDEA